MFPTGTIVTLINNDRQRDAENARFTRRAGGDEQPQASRRPRRRIRAFAARIAFTTTR